MPDVGIQRQFRRLLNRDRFPEHTNWECGLFQRVDFRAAFATGCRDLLPDFLESLEGFRLVHALGAGSTATKRLAVEVFFCAGMSAVSGDERWAAHDCTAINLSSTERQ